MALTWNGGCGSGGGGTSYIPGEGISITGNVISAIMNATNTYTKAEVEALLGDLEHVRMTEVAALPSTGETNIIYLVPKTGGGHDMYIWDAVNTRFVPIGQDTIDLSGYVTTTEFNNYDNVVLKTLPVAGWVLNGTTYTQTLTFNEIYSNKPVITACGATLGSKPTATAANALSSLEVVGDTTAKTMTFYSFLVAPTVDINLSIRGVS